MFFYICKNKVFAEKEKTEKDLKNEIQNNAKNLTTMLNNMPVIAYIVDTDFNIKACNTETLNYFDIELGIDGQIQQLSTDIFEGETMEPVSYTHLQRKLYPVVPPKTEYSLTERGKRLIPSIIELNKWGLAYLKEMDIPCKYKEE